MLEGGGTIASAMFGWDIADELYDNVSFTGFHTGYPDVGLALDASTARQLPWDDNRFLIWGELTKTDGSPLPICPRQVLKKVLRKADSLGLSAQVGMEFEWFVLKETELSVREKNYRNLETATQGLTNYSPFRIDGQHDFVRDSKRCIPKRGQVILKRQFAMVMRCKRRIVLSFLSKPYVKLVAVMVCSTRLWRSFPWTTPAAAGTCTKACGKMVKTFSTMTANRTALAIRCVILLPVNCIAYRNYSPCTRHSLIAIND